MNIVISNASDRPLYEQIVTQIKQCIMREELKEGEALPSMRYLAKELRISVITTKRAYEELEREGFIETVTGKGSFVAARNKELIREEQYRQIENYLNLAMKAARESGMADRELLELFEVILNEA